MYTEKQNVLDDYNDLLSVKDLAKLFDVSKMTIYKEMKAGKFGTPIKIGRAFKVPLIYIKNRYFTIDD